VRKVSIPKKASDEKKLLYIEGVYKRYGESQQNLIIMENALKKLNTIALVLKDLQCSNVLIFKGEFSAPTSSCVIFGPSPAVKERLQIQHILIQKDIEEKEILRAYEKGQIKIRKPSKDELGEIKSIAKNTFRKNRRITIRLYDHDYKGIQKKAMEVGIPYQTLISGLIHCYVEGDLVEKKAG